MDHITYQLNTNRWEEENDDQPPAPQGPDETRHDMDVFYL
jgi:hypothetical protein